MALGPGGEGAALLVVEVDVVDHPAGGHPAGADGLGDRVQAVANHAEDALDADLLKGLDDEVGDVGDPREFGSDSRNQTV